MERIVDPHGRDWRQSRLPAYGQLKFAYLTPRGFFQHFDTSECENIPVKQFLRFLAVLIFCVNAMSADLSVGKQMPDIQAKLLDSHEDFQLSQKRGKTIIVNLWATWCGPCKAEMPILQAYLDAHKADGLEVLAITMDDASDAQAVKKIARQYSFQVALKADANLKGLGRIWRMPTTFVIDKEGILRKNGHVGDAEISAAELDSLVTPLLGK